jgi:hypothetical protein
MKRTMTIALILGLLCTACFAHAVPTSDVLEYLKWEGFDPSEQYVRDHMLNIGESGVAEVALDVALTLEMLYYDEETFPLCWRTENLRPEAPVLVLYTEVTIDGVRVQALADHPVSQWYPEMFGLFMAGDPINNLVRSFRANTREYAWRGEVEVTAAFVIKRPTKPLVVVDPEIHVAYEDERTETDRQAMIKAMQEHGVTIASPDEMDATEWEKEGYLVVNRYGEHFLAGEWIGREDLTGLDFPETEEKEVRLSFSAPLDALLTHELSE